MTGAHERAKNHAEFLNAVVQKIWIEDNVLLEYAALEGRLQELLAVLESEVTR